MSNSTQASPKNDTAIFLNEVSVLFRVPSESIKTFKEYIIRMVQGKIKHKSFYALKQINLEVKKGEIFGILGRNGAGKSTLLKVISKVLIPIEGRVWIKGTISPLLQLGAGFHPELSGRENIFLNATLLGHTRNEIYDKLDDIIAFAAIGNFIEAPLRTYSTGMKSRLGFAVATAWQPDILILDEVLSVGDLRFKRKCFRRMERFRDSGATVIMVTHSIKSIRELCKRSLWLDQGKIKLSGHAKFVCDAYEKEMEK